MSPIIKDVGQPPQYSTLAPIPANQTAKYVQSFDERAIMSEEPPTIAGGPKGSPAVPALPTVVDGARRLNTYGDGVENMRADNQVLVRATPTSDKGTKDSRPNFKLRIYRDASGEMLP